MTSALVYTWNPARRGEKAKMPLWQRHSNICFTKRRPDRRQWAIAPAEFPSGMLGADAPAFETYSKGAGIERIECRHAINDDEPVN